MELTLRTCGIRPWMMDDAASMQRHADNRKIWLSLRDRFPHPYLLEHARTFIEAVTQDSPATHFAITVDGEPVGELGLELGSDVHRRTAELGYWLGEAFWGRGIMSEAVEAFTRAAFETFDLDRICAMPYARNGASARVLEKAGFALEGRLRANVIKDGEVLDSLLYARIR